MQLVDASERVRDFYDQHPYPPPIDDLNTYKQSWHDQERRIADFRLFWPGRPYQEKQSILVAGCGTSQAAKHALRWPAAQVIGIDYSATSVRNTNRLKRQHNLKNLHVHQLAIEHVNKLGMSFDQIVCTGVLHHLADPDLGLRALRDVLKPDGAVQIMLYAPYGRTGIYMLQEFCRRVGIRADDGGIRDLIRALGALPMGHPLHSVLAEAPELRESAAVADALLHPRDRAYTVPELFEFIENAQMVFGRWLKQAPYSVHCGVISQIPQVADIAALPIKEQYAVIELFRGTMIRHSAVVYRNDCSSSVYTVSFGNDDWLGYVPVRTSDTICIQDRVARDAVSVLINRTHTCKDVFLPVSATEKTLFDAIDGQQTIRNIVDKTLLSADLRVCQMLARKLFERLWWHDQVVFDTQHEMSV